MTTFLTYIITYIPVYQSIYSTFIPTLNPKFHTELELSAQEKAAEPPLELYVSIIPTTDPYVPATIRKVPDTITNILKPAMKYHFLVLVAVPQLS